MIMAPDAAPPHRTPGDRIRRAQLCYAAGGFDDFAPVAWIKKSGASVTDVLLAWRDGKLAELPAGKAWDAVHLPINTGSEALRDVRAMGGPCGPVLRTTDAFIVLVAVGTASDWDLPGITVLGDGDSLRVPHPVMHEPYEHDGCTWVKSPRDDTADTLTDADDLYGAYVCAAGIRGSEGTG